jgi:eukaryotic-like serine/threonine-protein kinase
MSKPSSSKPSSSKLSSEQWLALGPYLEQALDLAAPERAAWLSSIREQDPVLGEQLASLLEEHDVLSEAGFLEGSVTPPSTAPGLAGQVVGPYTLISLLGQGGMGSVWLAERTDGRFERRVAVKFLNLALVGRGGEERFKREGSILGRLTHPHIAELADAGVSTTGTPYLVLEYVEGEHIDRYSDQRQLDVEARVRLFLDVADAVAHAHSNLIVHRDLKPSNVLVSKSGEVKLLDFGIAKLLEGEGQDGSATLLTVQGGRALTPEYAAPEQITGAPVTTATDVYSLGVLLYVLLTGQHPAGSGTRSPAELVKAIVETDPQRLSDIVTSTKGDEDTTTGNATRRTTTPEKLRRLLRGDLDTIVAKALKKNPSERYISVTAFADDLVRYLKHEPISARPDTYSYRAAKFVRRHRTAVALATLALIAIFAGIGGTLLQARRARVQRDFALRQLARAEAVNDLNSFIFTQSPLSKETFDLASRVLGRQQGISVTSRVHILISLGSDVELRQGDLRGQQTLEEAYRLSRQENEPSTRANAACALAETLSAGDQFARADKLIREGLSELPEEPQYALDRAACLIAGGVVSRANGATTEAIDRLQLAQRLLELAPPHSQLLDLRASMFLADAFRQVGQNREACIRYEQTAARLTAIGQDDLGLAGSTYYKWGLSLTALGRPLEAEKLIHRAIVIFSDSEEDPNVVPWQLVAHARAIRDLGLLGKAFEQAERGYAQSLKNGDTARVNQALLLRASIYRMRENLPGAQGALDELATRLQTTPPGDLFFASLDAERALVKQKQGDLNAALDLINQSVRIAEAAVKAGNQGAELIPVFLTSRSNLQRLMGRTADAVADAITALDLQQEAAQPGTFSCDVGRSYLALGLAQQAQSNQEKSLLAFRSAAEHLQNSLGPNHSDTREARQLAGLDPSSR